MVSEQSHSFLFVYNMINVVFVSYCQAVANLQHNCHSSSRGANFCTMTWNHNTKIWRHLSVTFITGSFSHTQNYSLSTISPICVSRKGCCFGEGGNPHCPEKSRVKYLPAHVLCVSSCLLLSLSFCDHSSVFIAIVINTLAHGKLYKHPSVFKYGAYSTIVDHSIHTEIKYVNFLNNFTQILPFQLYVLCIS